MRIVTRDVTDDDRKKNVYFDHMAGLTGSIQNIYSATEIAVKVDVDALSRVTKDVHKQATERMRERFLGAISEEQKKQLTPEELNFNAHFVLLVQGSDLEKAN